MSAACWGGPLDGQRVNARGAFKWFDATGRGFDAPDAGRHLYRWHGTGWAFIGHRAYSCASCRAIIIGLSAICPWCGESAR